MKKIKLIETFDNTPSISLVEDCEINESVASSRVDGKYIIGMIEGQFFKPDGMSRNQRWYPKSLWEKALNNIDVKNRFLTSTMFGEIGHSDGPVEDMTLRNGCASHFIDKMWIDESGRGMGRAYILNTPTGQLLKTYLGAGCKLKVSTRGEGLYKEGCTHEGCPVVDDETYELQTADFVINPGFLETSAILKEHYINANREYTKTEKKQIEETIAHVKKEGEIGMDLNMDAYVRELKEELKSAKDENKSLREELQAKERELLEKQFVESAEIKKLNEQYAPFKKFKVSAKTLNETVKRSQKALKEAQEENVKLSEELKSFKDKCGSLEQIEEATRLSAKSLSMISEYQKIGSISEIKKMAEELKEAKSKLVEADKLAKSVSKTIKTLKEAKLLEKQAKKAAEILESYQKTVGTLKEAKALVAKTKTEKITESKKVKGVKLSEALSVSRNYGCTIESASKLIKKHGLERAKSLLEKALNTKKGVAKQGLKEGAKLVEEVAQLDKVTNVPAEKSAKDFLTIGMINNYFNQDALGKEFKGQDLNDIDGTEPKKSNSAKELLKKYADKVEVEKCDAKLDKEHTPAEAEAEAKKILKK